MKKLLLILIPTLSFGATINPCDAPTAILTLVPGAQFIITNTADLNTIVWQSTMTQPSNNQITTQMGSCVASSTSTIQLQAWSTELSTTSVAVAAAASGYVGASAVQQIQINAKMARIIQLKQLLNIQQY